MIKQTLQTLGLAGLLLTGCATTTATQTAPATAPVEDVGAQLRARHGCIGEADIPQTSNISMARTASAARARTDYLRRCLHADEATVSLEVEYDFDAGRAYAFPLGMAVIIK